MSTTRILIVDDEPDVLAAWERALELAGYTVTAASNATEALTACKTNVFDLVLLDFIMPGMTGVELLNKIREYLPTIRSIIVSGKVDTSHPEEQIKAELRADLEADAYFHKPLKNEKLLETIRELLESDKDKDWRDVAERELNAKKSITKVRKTEQELRKKKARSAPKKKS